MLNNLTDNFTEILKKLKGHGKLTEQNIRDAMREIRRALLEADVNFRIVKEFINSVSEEAIGVRVMKSLTPGHQVVKIVHENLIRLMGESGFQFNLPANRLNKIMLVGLQGSGKTTTCAKLAYRFQSQSLKPVMVSCDIYRPAAMEQLAVLGRQLDIPVITDTRAKKVAKLAKDALKEAEKLNSNLVIFDTAGRLHVDNELMRELVELKKILAPDYIFLVADAMTGQDAVNVSMEFNQYLDLQGVILSKMDSDTRGGAALSIRKVTGKPLVFIGTGEKVKELEEFHPERMAGRILGMGDVLGLIEKAETIIDQEKSEEIARKLKKNLFTFSDFLDQLQQLRKMGPLENIMGMMPGMGKASLKGLKVDEKELKQIEAIIFSMTAEEREKPIVINGNRRHRIARGSGTSVQQVNRLLKQFEQMKKMMKKFNNPNFFKGKMLPF